MFSIYSYPGRKTTTTTTIHTNRKETEQERNLSTVKREDLITLSLNLTRTNMWWVEGKGNYTLNVDDDDDEEH